MTANMTEENKRAALDEEDGDSGELKRRLLTRVGIAAVLILALLGGLATLDSMNVSVNAPPPAKPAEVVAEAPTRPTSNPDNADSTAPTQQVPPLSEDKPAEQVVQASTEEAKKPEEINAAPETSAPPTSTSTPRRADAAEPIGAGRALTKPAGPRLAMMKPSEATTAAKPLERSQPAAELARQANPTHVGAPAARPLTQAAARSAAGASGGAYLLQLGVFTSTAHAEELRAKLELNGITAQIESRVQVGPFSSREEADQMREKLRKLGMEGGVLVATKK